jgi:hypothetical protein
LRPEVGRRRHATIRVATRAAAAQYCAAPRRRRTRRITSQ